MKKEIRINESKLRGFVRNAIVESLDDEMAQWKEREQTPFYQILKQIDDKFGEVIMPEKDEYGMAHTPIGRLRIAWTLDGNDAATAKAVCSVLDNYDMLNNEDPEMDELAQQLKDIAGIGGEDVMESSIRRAVREAVMRRLNEVNNLTADSAYVKAKQKYDDLVANGQENTPEAEKRKRQMQQFQDYTTFKDVDENDPTALNAPNEFGNTPSNYMSDIANAYGMKDFKPKNWLNTQRQYSANGDRYDHTNMTQRDMQMHQEFENLPYNKQNYNDMKSPEEFGLTYQPGKKGFMGIGRKPGKWTTQQANESALHNAIKETVRRILKENGYK